MAQRNRRHIVIDSRAQAEPYTRPPRAIGGKTISHPEDRGAHAAALTRALRDADTDAREQRERLADELPRAAGIFITFESFPGVELAMESLDPRRGKRHPELLAVKSVQLAEGIREQATVYVPDGTLGYFLKRLSDYAQTSEQEKPKNRNLVDRIASIGLASLEQLWTDSPEEFPDPQLPTWWELWLRREDGHSERARVARFAQVIGAELGSLTLGFPDRTVMLIHTSAEQLTQALGVLDDLAEVRAPRSSAAPIALEPPAEQAEWVADLAQRTQPADQQAPAACLLDTGVFREHPLLAASLSSQDCHSCDPTWHTADHDGHGTEMAGLALFQQLDAGILGQGPVSLAHRLESVKLLPPPPAENPPRLYGALTASAASLVEIERPGRPRVFSLAITARWQSDLTENARALGQPTSWSAALDALAAGLQIDTEDSGLLFLDESELAARRLFIASAGNVDMLEDDHLSRSDVEPAEDPAQAWNALTVGAYTDLVNPAGSPGFEGWTPLAPTGELSPFSRTGVAFERGWPHKPDVVLEGGNAAHSPAKTAIDTPESMQLLTTKAPIRDQRLLTVTSATSAATAQAASLGASILADQPDLWPETVRGLIVHSAEWTVAMKQRFDGANSRASRMALLRRYGMGVPDLARATRSATDALTLIAQDTIHPFDGAGKTREMHLHALPWPVEALVDLGETAVRMRVTLSYFIEPNPARRGWARRYSYASHGLRYSVRQPTETTEEFRKRVNLRARAEDERAPVADSDANEWLFGPELRTAGSLHNDIWTGTAADLAARGVIAVFPVSGWWKERKDRDHSNRGARYALLVSIETPNQDVDIWTPVAQQVGIEIPIGT